MDCSHHRADEGMESPLVSREAVSSLPDFGNSPAKSAFRSLLLWGTSLLPGLVADLAIRSLHLSHDQETGCRRRNGTFARLLLGGNKTDSASRLARGRPLSSTRTNGEITGNSLASITFQEDRQFSCRTPSRCGARASPKRICPLPI